jgi:Fe-S cluster assembly ATP-binding protein
MRAAVNAHRAEEGKDPRQTAIPMAQFRKEIRETMAALGIDEAFARRYLNEGFSGGEKKRIEILQMSMLKPSMAVMDETDSGLDIDALKVVSQGVNTLLQANPEMGVLVITHYQRLLNYIKPNVVSVMMDGRIVREGGPELALELEERGYDFIREEVFGNGN